MLDAFDSGDIALARRIHLGLFPLFKGLFLESNPGPVKRALAVRGLIAEEFRLPLVPVAEKTALELGRMLEIDAIDSSRLSDRRDHAAGRSHWSARVAGWARP